MDFVELLRRCQGSMNQSEFAEHLGITSAMLSMIYSGQRNAGRTVLAALVRRFPEVRDAALDRYIGADSDDPDNGNGQPAPCSQGAQ